MRADLDQIDLSPIGELVRIRNEERVLEERLAKMEAQGRSVSPQVYARVKGDYETRRNELARGSQPLKERALREYQRLKAVRAEIERALQQVTLEKEELEFRRDLGEFREEEFTARIAECEKRLADERGQLEDVLQMRDTFVSAFRSETELESGEIPPAPQTAAAPPPAPLRPAAPPPAPPAPVVHATPPAARSVEDSVTPDGTVVAPGRQPGPPGRVTSTPGVPPPIEPSGSATAILPRARLCLLEGNEPVKEFVLKPGISVIGRLVQSDIQIPSPDVSRRHAQVTLGPDGCFVADLGSENGVAVNGRLVETHRLVDGDVVVLGKQRLVFRE